MNERCAPQLVTRRSTAMPSRSRLIALAGALTALASGCSPKPAVPQVRAAYVRLPAVPGNPAAAYFRIEGGLSDDRLLAVSGLQAARAELHASMQHGAGMTMAPLTGVDVPAGGTVLFAPGGRHVMLFGLPATVAPGTRLPIMLRFRSGARVDGTATAIAAGDPAPDEA